jgi:hypothetical protein
MPIRPAAFLEFRLATRIAVQGEPARRLFSFIASAVQSILEAMGRSETDVGPIVSPGACAGLSAMAVESGRGS